MIWIALGFIGLLLLWQWVISPFIQFLLDLWGRRIFKKIQCPQCNTLYDATAVWRAKHVVKMLTYGGPPPAPFTILPYEAWDLTCNACGASHDFTSQGEPIVIQESPPDPTEPSADSP